MKSKLSYFIFNKPSDYARGHLENTACRDGGIVAGGAAGGGRGKFLSRVLDSYQADMNWHRICFEVVDRSAGAYKLTVYATNSLEFERGGVLYRVDELIRSTEHSFEEKLDLLEPFVQKQITGQRDVLLHDVVGRYLWMALEMYPQGQEEIFIFNITVYLPSRSWLEYLPAVYQRADLPTGFLDRYLGIFQTLYEDLNFNIRRVADYFDAGCCDEEFLHWLADWLDLSDRYLWSEDKLRKFLSRAVELYLKRGTRESIEDIVEIFAGAKPYIVETFQLEKFKDQEEYETTLLPMYGDDPLCFTVLVKEEHVKTVQDMNILMKIIEEMKPVHMELKLVILKPYIFLNHYSFLGINSVLGQYRDLTLDGSPLLTLAVITNREGEAGK